MKHDALATTAQALAITSQLLAIGIEVGIIAGGYFVYTKLVKPESSSQIDAPTKFTDPAVLVPEGYELVPTAPVKEETFRQRWEKLGRIFKAVVG